MIKKIIACLDIADNGRVVKGVKFEGLKDVGDPLELARHYNNEGADELAFLDINASFKSRSIMIDLLRRVAQEINLPLSAAGGIRTVDDMRDVMNAGANKVSVCSSALERPELLSEMAEAYGSQCVVLSIDAKRVDSSAGTSAPAGDISSTGTSRRWNAFSKGGRIDTGLDAVEWAIKAESFGAGEIILNSIDADGTGSGYDIELCMAVSNAVKIPVIASSGAGSLDQIAEVFLKTNASAALVASILHFKKTTIPEIKEYLKSKGISVK